MKIDPGFLNHWKTEILLERLGSDGVVAILRLWGNAQIRRQYSGLELNPRRLAMETKWRGDAQLLFDTLTDPDAPWLDREEGGTYSIHDFTEHQKHVLALWENGKRGGRPKKVSPTPSSKEEHTLTPTLTPIGFETKPNGFQTKPNGFSVDEVVVDEETPELSDSLLSLEKRVQALRTDWRLPLTYAEQRTLRDNSRTFQALTDDDWRILKEFLHYKPKEGEAFTPPRSRAKFLEWIPDVHRQATHWSKKNGHNGHTTKQPLDAGWR